jgi:hypothetical protein
MAKHKEGYLGSWAVFQFPGIQKTGQIKTSKSDFPPLFHVLHKEQRTKLTPTVFFVILP